MTVHAAALEVWIAAIDEGYFISPVWVPWAERELHLATPVPPWLLDLCDAVDAGSAVPLLCAGLRWLDPKELCGGLDRTSLHLGMLWLRYERGDLTLAQVLSRAAVLADRAPACTSTPHAAADLLGPHAEMARGALLRQLGIRSM